MNREKNLEHVELIILVALKAVGDGRHAVRHLLPEVQH